MAREKVEAQPGFRPTHCSTCPSELDRFVHLPALRATRTVHVGVVGIDVAATAAAEDVVLARGRLEAPPAQLGIDAHPGQARPTGPPRKSRSGSGWTCASFASGSGFRRRGAGGRRRKGVPPEYHPAPDQRRRCLRGVIGGIAPQRFKPRGLSLFEGVLVRRRGAAAREQNDRDRPAVGIHCDPNDAIGQDILVCPGV